MGLLRAKCLFYFGQLQDALDILKELMSLEPDNSKAQSIYQSLQELYNQNNLAKTAFKQKDFTKAREHYDLALTICPTDNHSIRIDLLFSRAKVHSNLRDHTCVIQDCSEIIQMDSNHLKAYLKRAAAYLVLGGKDNCEKAMEDYQTAKSVTNNEDQMIELDLKIKQATAQSKRCEEGGQDLYQMLGVSRDATESEIKRNYRKMALKMHPDRRSQLKKEQNTLSFRDINRAYEILSDFQRRDRYDHGVENP